MTFLEQYDTAQNKLTQALISVTRTTGHVAAEDPSFLRLSDESLDAAIDQRSQRLLALTEKLLRKSAISEAPRLNSLASIETQWQTLVDSTDNLLERADMALDEYRGYARKRSPVQNTTQQSSRRPLRNFRDADVPKPQLQFLYRPSNFPTKPFKPLLTSKPHASKSLKESLAKEHDESGVKSFIHPYAEEISAYHYAPDMVRQKEPVESRPVDENAAIWVDSEDGVHEMLRDLKEATEIAVDLEHHDNHSYLGMVSLMQISTRNQDWIVDTLQPWRCKLEILNEVFTDPKILKVFHGCSMDIIWLQRDLGIYVVGLFDTYHAARALNLAGRGLAFLLKTYVDFDAQKQYQTADWRIRPLPQELFDYARSDTHYLLYVFDCMRNELVHRDAQDEGDRINFVLEQSKLEALQRYEYPQYAEVAEPSKAGWFSAVARAPRLQTDAQLAVFIAVHKWRDAVARENDEGLHTIMPAFALYNIVSAMPSDLSDLMRAAQPISRFVRPRTEELLQLIRQAKVNPTLSAKDVYDAVWEKRSRARNGGQQASPPSIEKPGAAMCDQPSVSEQAGARLSTSQFWGKAVPEHQSVAPSVDITIPPLHAWTQADTASFQTDLPTEDLDATTTEAHHEVPSEKPNAAIPQKREAQGTPFERPNDVPRLDAISSAAANGLHASSKSHKKQKLAARPEQESGKAFDYESVPSMLNGTSAQKHQVRKQKHNPYLKATNTTESLKSGQYPRAGKTSVFK